MSLNPEKMFGNIPAVRILRGLFAGRTGILIQCDTSVNSFGVFCQEAIVRLDGDRAGCTFEYKFDSDDDLEFIVPQTQEQTMTGNQSANIFLYNDKVRAILCNYEPDPPPPGPPKPREYFKTFDKALKVGDLVIVPSGTRHNFTITRIAAVDVEIDFENLPARIQWIVGKIDFGEFNHNIELEGQANNAIRDADKAKRRRELADKLMASAGDALNGLPIVTLAAPEKPDGTQ